MTHIITILTIATSVFTLGFSTDATPVTHDANPVVVSSTSFSDVPSDSLGSDLKTSVSGCNGALCDR